MNDFPAKSCESVRLKEHEVHIPVQPFKLHTKVLSQSSDIKCQVTPVLLKPLMSNRSKVTKTHRAVLSLVRKPKDLAKGHIFSGLPIGLNKPTGVVPIRICLSTSTLRGTPLPYPLCFTCLLALGKRKVNEAGLKNIGNCFFI